ncbi:hypothetical protein FA13DRAFT_1746234 [Coprinellus micaceus]|uniref:G domain-containing protein n=1 Tax=Coprinellus micaceus TaxID=71717 RepID=A0A4Y7S9Q7_COPMI|nr:hypothetical protein FA13DRAFT_1746234 [Coprinellus micaceus]
MSMMKVNKKVPLTDSALLDARPTDIVIPIMGATGAGKSTFINLLLGHIGSQRARVRVGDQLASCTYDLESVVIEGQTTQGRVRPVNLTEQHRIVIVDTPGFDDTTASDFQILKRIANWLEESFRRNMILGGVIYLHDISQDRFSGTARRNLEMFNSLCGEAALDKVVLVTSKWSRHGGRDFKKRVEELQNVHWKEMLYPPQGGHGARVMQLTPQEVQGRQTLDRQEGASAWLVIHHILSQLDRRLTKKTLDDVLQIQDELVKRRKSIPETKAAKELREQLEAALRIQEEMLALESEAASGDPEAEKKLREKEGQLREMHDAIQQNKLSLWARITRKFRFQWLTGR